MGGFQNKIESLASKVKGGIYRNFFVKAIKEKLRPIKHFFFGKSGIYLLLDRIAVLSGGREIKTVFDVGAAVGDTAVTFLRTFPAAKVYCFEPQTRSRQRLERRLKPYGSRAEIIPLGFYNSPGTRMLHLDASPDGSSLLPEAAPSTLSEEEISLATLDQFVRERKIGRIDLLKIDVEGVEKEVLEGGLETLGRMVDHVIIEISFNRRGLGDRAFLDVFRYLYDADFVLVEITDNFYFVKRALAAKQETVPLR